MTEEGADARGTLRTIVDGNAYLTLATADASGRPWGTPVWFAHDGYTDFLWLSRPAARHSQNIAVRPEIAITIFDSTVPVGEGQAVYVEATAQEVGGPEVERGVGICARRQVAHGVAAWGVAQVTGDAPFRLFRARASAHFVLDDHDQRIAVDPTP